MNRQYLYILCGLPFAGKTTLAKELVKRCGFVRVDLDEINSERGLGGLGNNDLSDKDWKITYQESYHRVDKALQQGQTVINDTANFTKEQRDKLRVIAQKYGIPTKVIYVNISDHLARNRWQDNRLTKARYDVKDEDFAEVADNFQIPTADENIIYYDQTIPLEKWIDRNFI